ncbi:HlyD family secretion protein [Candidatus Protochlamydia amoebophila]|nr:hypothetical protein [Candidatus Protochlamydia amoebophila]
MDKSYHLEKYETILLFFICALSIASLFLIVFSMWKESQPKEVLKVLDIKRPASPFSSYIAAVGVVEAGSENIFIGTPINRIVDKIFVTVGNEVHQGNPLIQFENRDLEANLKIQELAYQIAQAHVQKLESFPRKEDLQSAEASLKKADIEYLLAKNQYEMTRGMQDSRALSQEEMNRRLFRYQEAEANKNQMQANMEKIQAGTWLPDLKIAQLEALQMKARMNAAKIDIERTLLRSPITGRILQINIHEGEHAGQDSSKMPMMVLGNTNEKHLEVSINQFNAPYFKSDAPAVAFLQGDSNIKFQLEFIKFEPYLVNKQNFTNNLIEKVDSKVLKVTYRFKENDQNIFVGQIMDVFIQAEYPWK